MPHSFPCISSSSAPAALRHCPACLNIAVQNVTDAPFRASTIAKDNEPQSVFRLFFESSAVADWTLHFNAWQPALLYSGVFTHQRPYCTFGSQTCELGDLMLVYSDHTRKTRSAVLLQAKAGHTPWPPSASPAQWDLYTTWPAFSYNPNGTRVTRTLPFSGKAHPAAQYLTINPPAKDLDTSEANTPASWSYFDHFLTSFFNGSAGHKFSWTRASATNDWDHLVWDLLEHTWKKAVGSRTARATGVPRGQGAYLLASSYRSQPDDSAPLTSKDYDALLRKRPDSPETFNDEWGIPIIHIDQGEARFES